MARLTAIRTARWTGFPVCGASLDVFRDGAALEAVPARKHHRKNLEKKN
jgi:hypothetical protein